MFTPHQKLLFKYLCKVAESEVVCVDILFKLIDFVGLLSDLCIAFKNAVGKIDMRRDITFISICNRAAGFFANEINNTDYRGLKVKTEILRNK